MITLGILSTTPGVTKAEVVVDKEMNHLYTCSVDIWKEIYNGHFTYWHNNIGGNWQIDPMMGHKNDSSWHDTRMCLIAMMKIMSESSSMQSAAFSPPGSYTVTHSVEIEDDTRVVLTWLNSHVGDGGKFAVIYSLDEDLMLDSINDTYHCESFYFPKTPNLSHTDLGDNPKWVYFEDHGTGIHFTSGCEEDLANMDYFTITTADGETRTRSDYSVVTH